jgi:hypothetical protein
VTRYLLLLLPLLATGCQTTVGNYFANRGRDLGECFLVQAGVGLGSRAWIASPSQEPWRLEHCPLPLPSPWGPAGDLRVMVARGFLRGEVSCSEDFSGSLLCLAWAS